jgi:uncharacterized membrane protein YphA (DoxX/SURF4 family)
MSIAIACQIVIALGIFNVWIVRRNRPTPYRPEGAVGIEEEFERYGFPAWMWMVVGGAKLTLAVLLLVGVFVPAVAPLAAGAMAVLMLSAIAAHVRVSDPLVKSVPALAMLVLSLVVVVSHTA